MLHMRPAKFQELEQIYFLRHMAMEARECPQLTPSFTRIQMQYKAYGSMRIHHEWDICGGNFTVAETSQQDHPFSQQSRNGRYMVGSLSQYMDYDRNRMIVEGLYSLATMHRSGRQLLASAIYSAESKKADAIELDAIYIRAAQWYKNTAQFSFVLPKDARTGKGTMVLYRENFKNSLYNMDLKDKQRLQMI